MFSDVTTAPDGTVYGVQRPAANRLSSKRQALGAVLCAAAGYLRVAADKHWVTDVLVGAGVGFGMSRIAR